MDGKNSQNDAKNTAKIDKFSVENAVSRVPAHSYPMIDGIAVYAYGYKWSMKYAKLENDQKK